MQLLALTSTRPVPTRPQGRRQDPQLSRAHIRLDSLRGGDFCKTRSRGVCFVLSRVAQWQSLRPHTRIPPASVLARSKPGVLVLSPRPGGLWDRVGSAQGSMRWSSSGKRSRSHRLPQRRGTKVTPACPHSQEVCGSACREFCRARVSPCTMWMSFPAQAKATDLSAPNPQPTHCSQSSGPGGKPAPRNGTEQPW